MTGQTWGDPLRSAANVVWLIQPEMWSNHDQLQAINEGWCIVLDDRPGMTYICRFIEAMRAQLGAGIVRPFTSDTQAAEFVMERANQGSEFHMRAWQANIKAQLHGAGA